MHEINNIEMVECMVFGKRCAILYVRFIFETRDFSCCSRWRGIVISKQFIRFIFGILTKFVHIYNYIKWLLLYTSSNPDLGYSI